MLWVPKKGILRAQTNLDANPSATPGTTVTTGASSSTKGSVAELIASTNFDAWWIRVVAGHYSASATASKGALDILIGASTEEVLIADLLFGGAGGSDHTVDRHGPKVWDFPLYIPAGSRLAAQAAGERTSQGFEVAVFLYGGDGSPPFQVGGKVTTYGMGTVPTGTAITPGASGAEGSWTQIVASTTRDHFAFLPSWQIGTDTTHNRANHYVEIGVGSATEESIGEWWFMVNALESMHGPVNSWPAFADVPSGTRLTMRASCSGSADTGDNGVIHAVS